MTTDHNESMRLAEWLKARQSHLGASRESCWDGEQWCWDNYDQAAALLRKLPERIAELEAAQAGIIQAITDPENQPSQYGTVTIEMHAEDGFVIERMGQLLAETVLILRGPPPKLTRWSYHDIPERVAALRTERDTLREEVGKLHEAIDAFCEGNRWAVDAWKNRPDIKPLFDIDTARKATQ